MSQHARLLFLAPPLTSHVPALVAWIGGALVTAKILVNPFYAAKFLARRSPNAASPGGSRSS